MKIKASWFDAGREVDCAANFHHDGRIGRLSIRRVGAMYELYLSPWVPEVERGKAIVLCSARSGPDIVAHANRMVGGRDEWEDDEEEKAGGEAPAGEVRLCGGDV